MTSNTNTATPAIDRLRDILPAVDPAALTGADRRAVIDLLAASFAAVEQIDS